MTKASYQSQRTKRPGIGTIAQAMLVLLLVSGCVKSKDPLVSPDAAVFPLGDHMHLQEYSFDQKKGRWSATTDATLTKENGQYKFEVRDEHPLIGVLKLLEETEYGTLYLAQTQEWTHYEYGVVIVNAKVPAQQQKDSIAVLGIDCPRAPDGSRVGDCDVSDLAGLITLVKGNDWPARLLKASTVYHVLSR